MINKKLEYFHVAMIVFFILLTVFFVAISQKTSLMGNLFHDTLVFDGISYAISQGLKPSVDFYATMIVSFYMRYFANIIADGAFVENIELWMYSVILGIVFFALLYKKVKPLALLTIISVTILFMMVRLNYGMVAVSINMSFLFNHAGNYNRFLDLLIMGVIFSAIPSLDYKIVKYVRIVFYSIVLLLGIYTKISTFMIFLLLITTIILLSRNYKILDLIAIYILTIMGVIATWYLTGIGSEYFHFLSQLGEYKSIRFKEEIVYLRYKGFVSHSLYDAIVIAISLLMYNRLFADKLNYINIKKDILLQNKGKYLRISPEFYIFIISVFSILSVAMFALTNYGDMGFLPLAALYYTARKTLYMHNIKLSQNAKKIFIILFFAFIASYAYKTIKAGVGRIYYMSNTEFMPLSKALDILDVNNSIHTENKIYDKYFINKDKVDELIDDKNILEILTPQANLFTHKNYLASFYLFEQMNHELDTLHISKDKSIYLLDFPAYYIAMLRNSRVPKYTYPFILYNHEIGKEFHPKAEDLFRDVDVAIVTNISLVKTNKMYLNELYIDYITVNYNLLYQNKYYKIFEKKRIKNETK